MKRILLQTSLVAFLSCFSLASAALAVGEGEDEQQQHQQQRVINQVQVEPFSPDIRERLAAASAQEGLDFAPLVRINLPNGGFIESGVGGAFVALRADEYIYPDDKIALYRSEYHFLGEELSDHMTQMSNGSLGNSVLYFDSENHDAQGCYTYVNGWLFSPRFDDALFGMVPQGRELRTNVLNIRLVYSEDSRQIFLVGGNPPVEGEAH